MEVRHKPTPARLASLLCGMTLLPLYPAGLGAPLSLLGLSPVEGRS